MLSYLSALMDWISRNVLKVVFLIFLIVALFVKGMYSFLDMPYFEGTTLWDIGMGIVAFGIYAVIFYKRDWIQEKFRYLYGFLIFMTIAVCFIYLVPLRPFSDMEHVYGAAIKFATFQWEEILNDPYWNMFPSNVRLGVFWGILLLPFPKTLASIKVINALFAYGAIYYLSKLCKLHGLKYYKVIYAYLVVFSPLILYINHVYFDLPQLFFCVFAIYLYKKHDNIVLSGTVLSVAVFLRKSAQIFLIAMIFCEVFRLFKGVRFKEITKQHVKKICYILVAVVLCMGLSKGGIKYIKGFFYGDSYKSYPGWNQIYIGLNEPRLGMMDGDFSYDRDFGDIVERVQEYGVAKTGTIIAKKTFWLWTQGTYQAQRYAFGLDVQYEEEKFEYKTFLTNRLLWDTQPLRKMINAFMRAQYMALFGFMLLAMWKKKDISDMRIWYYIMIAVFLVMLVYELKSRYVMPCFPGMVILACQGMECLPQNPLRTKKNTKHS